MRSGAADRVLRLSRRLGYLTRLTNRMQQRGWRADDPAYRAAWAARDALHELCVRLHYQSRGDGYGRRGGSPT